VPFRLATYLIGLLTLLQLAGCAGVGPTALEPTSASATLGGGTVIVERLPPTTNPGGLADQPLSTSTVIVEPLAPLPETAPDRPVIAEALTAPPTPSAAAVPKAKTPAVSAAPAVPAAPKSSAADKPVVKAPPKTPAPVAHAPPSPKPQSAPPVRAETPTLGLDALEQRLKDTDAIGIFTKITLKNQVDDLLKQFKAHHHGNSKTPIAQLRQGYDQLLLNVNDLLKNGDPSLARQIMASREAIWNVLTDPVKFAKL
jgi:hypothetical protein